MTLQVMSTFAAQMAFMSPNSTKAQSFICTVKAYHEVFHMDCSKPVKQLPSQFISTMHMGKKKAQLGLTACAIDAAWMTEVLR